MWERERRNHISVLVVYIVVVVAIVVSGVGGGTEISECSRE